MAPAAPVARSARTRPRGDVRRGTVANGGGHAQIVEIQRARILAATFDVVCERGAGNVSVADVVERSGVSRRTFYELFTDREDCFLAAFEDALGAVRERVLPAYLAESKWCGRVRAALSALLCFCDQEPNIGQLLVCESLAFGPETLRRRERMLALLTSAVDEGRGQATGTADPPSLTAEGLVGGVLSVIHTRLSASREPLAGLTSQLMSMIVLPYLGPAAARRELERPLPAPVSGGREAASLSDPFKEAGMRITYRTVRVLMAIAELAEQGLSPSNRLVGERAGITDQGQISKLLTRLCRIGLIGNSGLGPGLGGPNEWSLTAKGQDLIEGIRVSTGGPA
jgi:AcrR family transcriptional regulator